MSQQYEVRKTRLGNGLVVLSEPMPQVRSVSFGVFLRTGSRHEAPDEHGLTHFIEHALFKGTRRRSASRIAEESDALGGHLDAFTGREMVGFYNKVLDVHLERAFELHRRPGHCPRLQRGRAEEGAQRHPRRDQDGRGHP